GEGACRDGRAQRWFAWRADRGRGGREAGASRRDALSEHAGGLCPLSRAGDRALGQADPREGDQTRIARPCRERHITRHSPVCGSRRSVGSVLRTAGSVPAFTRSSSALTRRASFITQRTTIPVPSAPSASLTNGEMTMGGMDGLLFEPSYSP